MPEKQSFQETLDMRISYMGRPCKLHYAEAPLKITKASRQYMYDDSGNEYLDCVSNISHVGHCHPHIVTMGQQQMAKLTTCFGFLNEAQSTYAQRLCETLPDKLCVCYFLNSGSEANDLALRLARQYTKQKDIICIDHTFHGNIGLVMDVSPHTFKEETNEKKDNIHVVPCPDTYRGKYRETEPDVGYKYAMEIQRAIDKAESKGRKVGAFIHEPLISTAGVIVPPPGYLQMAYSYVREAGGVCIADEIANGLGRVGDHCWSFQAHGVVPDIVTCGKPLGNGHPMALVITSREIADSISFFASTCGGNPVSCTIGIAVLDVIQNEKLMSSAKFVGRTLLEGFRAIMAKHPNIGDVRGMGMVVGVDMVEDKDSRKPAPEIAEKLTYKLKQERIIISARGPEKNVMQIQPPLCFTIENARHLINVFDRVLTEIEADPPTKRQPKTHSLGPGVSSNVLGMLQIPLGALTGDLGSDDFDEPSAKRRRYEDLD